MAYLPVPPALSAWEHEQARLFALQSTRLLDSPASENFDRITRMACRFFAVPIALITLIDRDRQWFKSAVGVQMRETCREDAFCHYTIQGHEVLVVEDATQDPRFSTNPLVTGEPGIRFYAGAPLIMPSGHALGSLCIIGREPRSLDEGQRRLLADMAALVMTEIHLHRSAGRVDEVTMLPNRAQLVQDLADLCLLSPDQPRTLVAVELMGHGAIQNAVRAVGLAPLEQLVRNSAQRLQAGLKPHSSVYVVGVARLAFMLDGAAIPEQMEFIEQQVLGLREPHEVGEVSMGLPVHAGVVSFELTADSVADVVRKATSALYDATVEEKPCVLYDPQADARYRHSYRLLQEVPRAIAQGQLRLVYQPKLDLASAGYRSVEALVRWQHPVLGNVPPAEFVPLVETTDLIHTLTEWVLHTALAQAALWRRQGLDLAVAVNVSARNLEHPDFLRMLANALVRHDIPPAMLHIECTEYAALTGRTVLESLQRIRAAGVQVALDDFGAGFSNLSCLCEMPAEILKIDKSLVLPAMTQERAHDLLSMVVALGHRMGYRMLAEGVETAEAFERLAAIGCDGMQGYYLARPMEAEAVPDFVRAGLPPAVLAQCRRVESAAMPAAPGSG